MAMQKARGEISYWAPNLQLASLRLMLGGDEMSFSIDDLYRTELLKLAAHVFKGKGGANWSALPNDHIIDCIKVGYIPEHVRDAVAERQAAKQAKKETTTVDPDSIPTFDNEVEKERYVGDSWFPDAASREAQAAVNAANQEAENTYEDIVTRALDDATYQGDGDPTEDAQYDESMKASQAVNQAARDQADSDQAPPPPSPVTIDDMVAAIATQIAEATAAANESAGEANPMTDESAVREIVAEALKPVVDDVTAIGELIAEIQPEIHHIHIGEREVVKLPGRQHEKFQDVLQLLGLGEHVYLVGPAGTGKSTLARHVAHALGIQCLAMSCNPQMPESRIFGYMDAGGTYRPSLVHAWWNEGGVFLLDEVDNGHPGILTAFNLLLSSDEMSWPDGSTTKRHDNAVVVAGANTYGQGANRAYIGRNVLDGAFLDRFTMVQMDIDRKLEAAMVKAHLPGKEGTSWLAKIRKIRGNVQKAELQVIVSPRAAVTGAKLKNLGWSDTKIIQSRVLRGLSPDQYQKAMQGVRVDGDMEESPDA